MRKIRKKFKRPRVSWDSDSIKENKELASEYGLRRRKEILISHEILRGFRQRARQLIAEKNEEKESVLMKKLVRVGLLADEKKELDDVLTLTVRDVLDRRLQTLIFKKGVATSPLHARQLIVHGHVKIKGRRVKFPSYLVPVAEEKDIEVVAGKSKPKKPSAGSAQAVAKEQEAGAEKAESGKDSEAKPEEAPDGENKPKSGPDEKPEANEQPDDSGERGD